MILQGLQRTHLAMVDAFIEAQRDVFDDFFFAQYAPAYFVNWKTHFKSTTGRDYDESRDFATLSNDLVAEYEDISSPLAALKRDLYLAINAEYSNTFLLHHGVGDWIQSVGSLSDSQRSAINRLLSEAKPGLTVDSIEQAVQQAITKAKSQLSQLSN
jgi:hypothetical protein